MILLLDCVSVCVLLPVQEFACDVVQLAAVVDRKYD